MNRYIQSATILLAALAFAGYYWSSTLGDSSHACTARTSIRAVSFRQPASIGTTPTLFVSSQM